MDKIVFRAYDKRRQQPVKVSPLYHRDKGGIYTGQGEYGIYELLTEEEKKKLPYLVTPSTVVSIHDGKAFDLNKPADKINWEWVQYHPYIALDREKGHSSRDVAFYVENKRKESSERINRDKLMTKAKMALYDASLADQKLVAKAYGMVSPDSFSEEEIQAFILNVIESSPGSVVDAFSPGEKGRVHIMAMLKDLLRHRVVVLAKGSYFHQSPSGVFLGKTEQAVVDFFNDPENSSLLDSMEEQLKGTIENKAEAVVQ